MKIIKIEQRRAVELILFGVVFRIGFYQYPWVSRSGLYNRFIAELIDGSFFEFITWLCYFRKKERDNRTIYHFRLLFFAIAFAVPDGYRFIDSVRAT